MTWTRLADAATVAIPVAVGLILVSFYAGQVCSGERCSWLGVLGLQLIVFAGFFGLFGSVLAALIGWVAVLRGMGTRRVLAGRSAESGGAGEPPVVPRLERRRPDSPTSSFAVLLVLLIIAIAVLSGR